MVELEEEHIYVRMLLYERITLFRDNFYFPEDYKWRQMNELNVKKKPHWIILLCSTPQHVSAHMSMNQLRYVHSNKISFIKIAYQEWKKHN